MNALRHLLLRCLQLGLIALACATATVVARSGG